MVARKGSDVDGNKKAFQYSKWLCFIVCLFVFIFSNHKLFNKFSENNTVLSTKSIQPSDDLIELPAVLICNENAFKTPVLYTDPGSYKQNTMDLDDFLIDALFIEQLNLANLNKRPRSMRDHFKEVVTFVHGTCYLINNKTKALLIPYICLVI